MKNRSVKLQFEYIPKKVKKKQGYVSLEKSPVSLSVNIFNKSYKLGYNYDLLIRVVTKGRKFTLWFQKSLNSHIEVSMVNPLGETTTENYDVLIEETSQYKLKLVKMTASQDGIIIPELIPNRNRSRLYSTLIDDRIDVEAFSKCADEWNFEHENQEIRIEHITPVSLFYRLWELNPNNPNNKNLSSQGDEISKKVK